MECIIIEGVRIEKWREGDKFCCRMVFGELDEAMIESRNEKVIDHMTLPQTIALLKKARELKPLK